MVRIERTFLLQGGRTFQDLIYSGGNLDGPWLLHGPMSFGGIPWRLGYFLVLLQIPSVYLWWGSLLEAGCKHDCRTPGSQESKYK
ncbi:hypothetical protein GDO81_001242 [Engystomops pustulosus]|uniref:Uncharacterized protein n=1 Tax=Engystomops pustulosus TaxID=76066 RepID=A0AAV7DBL9_ENGPU|nr:hypothetical protein GDO81_001242 [Engystomops pustulosus]